MIPGSVILARVQQSDGQLKRRPAVILALLPPYNDFLICGISSKIHQEVVGFDDVILHDDPDFVQSGLKVDSLVRLGLLATIPPTAVLGTLGSLLSERHSALLNRLANYLCSQEALTTPDTEKPPISNTPPEQV